MSCSFAFQLKGWRLVHYGLVVLFVGSAGGAVWMWLESDRLNDAALLRELAVSRQQAATERLRREQASVSPLTDDQISKIRQDILFANHMADKRQFSWTQLLDNLDKGIPSHVSISSVRLNFQDSTITMQGIVPSLQELMRLAEQLEDHPAFRGIRIGQHQAQSTSQLGPSPAPLATIGADKTPISFTLSAQYRPSQ